MLRVELQETDGACICRLEGRFTGEQAEHARMLATRCHIALSIVVDLTDVMYVDDTGEDVLLLLKRLGAQFIAETSYSRDVCERLDLPQASQSRT
jgi:anti-anti-sigma regulatory factor